MTETHIVKRKGHKEKFDEKKVYGSIYAACYVVHEKEVECEKTADSVTKHVKKWIKNKKVVSSENISKLVTKELKKHNKHAAFMYETHRDLS